MAVITWPGYRVSSFRWRKVNQAMTFRSIFGYQSLDTASPLWEASMTGVQEDRATARQIELFIESLNGYTNQLALWDVEHPVPSGTLRGSLSFAAAAAQGAASLSLVKANNNLLTNGENLSASGWSTGSTLGNFYTVSASTDVVAPDGGASNVTKFVANSTTSTLFARQSKTFGAGQHVTSLYIYVPSQSGTTSWRFQPDFQDTNAGPFTSASSVFDAWVRVSSATSVTADRTWLDFNIQCNNAAPTQGFTFYAAFAKDEIGTTPTSFGFGETLLRGDLLGFGNGLTQQVVRVASDAVSTGQGNITVNIGTPLRNAFNAGDAVVWDKPKALFRLKSLPDGIEYTPDSGQPWALSLIESYIP